MRIAAISDIHGNLYSLMKVLEDIDNKKVDMTICLGDLVGYGPHPNEVIALIKRRNIPCLKGNYDASVVDGDFTFIRDNQINSFSLPWAVEEVRASNKFFLESLPERLDYKVENKRISFVHGSPNKINEYLYEDKENTELIMNDFDGDILVCAHTHLKATKTFNNKIFVSTGSVGKPLSGTPNASYCIIDITEGSEVKISFPDIPYEFKRIVKDCEMLNFPRALIQSYETGNQ